jgi:hypothetical protein
LFGLLLTMLATGPYWLPVPRGQPRTVNRAVQRILNKKWLSDADRDWILRNPQADVCVDLHFSLGMAIRNQFGLWSGNLPLTLSCRRLHPDACSEVIIEALCRELREQADPVLVKALDAQFQRLDAIRIDSTGFGKLTLKELIARVQTQMDQQAVEQPGNLSGRIQIKVIGIENLEGSGFRFSWEEHESASLRTFLNRLAFRNGFRIRNDPPNVELVSKGADGVLGPSVTNDVPSQN